MKKRLFICFLIVLSITNAFGQEEKVSSKYGIEIFPQTVFFRIYSAQFVYEMSAYDHLIIGFTYLNNYYPSKNDAIGQFFSPTIPIGYRRYLWKNMNIETQLWPAYNFYKDLKENKFYNGFDLVGSIRFGYRFDFKIIKLTFYSNIQIEYLFGIYKGNKPENFDDVDKDLPIFPAISLGYKW